MRASSFSGGRFTLTQPGPVPIQSLAAHPDFIRSARSGGAALNSARVSARRTSWSAGRK